MTAVFVMQCGNGDAMTAVFVMQCGNGGAAMKSGNHASQKGGGGSGGGGSLPTHEEAQQSMELVGKGFSGEVYLDKDNNSVIKYAAGPAASLTQNEIEINQLAGELGVAPKVLASSKNAMATEYLKGFKALDDKTILENLPKSTQKKIAKNTVKQLETLHNNKINHNDFRPGNVMFNPRTGSVKIIDYGKSSKDSSFKPSNDLGRANLWISGLGGIPVLREPLVKAAFSSAANNFNRNSYKEIYSAIDKI